MSAVFLIVSKFGDPSAQALLQTTTGGYPHVTLFYSGQALPLSELKQLGQRAFDALTPADALYSIIIRASQVYINKFFHEKSQQHRYDVLIGVDPHSAEQIEALRRQLIGDHPKRASLFTVAPHITHSIHWDEAAATEACTALKAQMGDMSFEICVTGYTVD